MFNEKYKAICIPYSIKALASFAQQLLTTQRGKLFTEKKSQEPNLIITIKTTISKPCFLTPSDH